MTRVAWFAVWSAISAIPAFSQPATWQLDPAHSAAQFAVRHMMVSTVRGDFGRVIGAVQTDGNDFTKARVEASVEVKNINTREPNRDKHLLSPDFFDAEHFPKMTFVSKQITVAGPGRLKMTGDLTIRGTTREVTFDVDGPTPPIKDPRGGQRMGATATAKISRSTFGLNWNRAIEAGGVVVGDEVTITLDVEMVKPPGA